MSDPHVTITLGSSGKVVKRRNKRPWGEGDSEKKFSSTNKRFRNGLIAFNNGTERASGSFIAENDLRAKLIHKRRKNQIQNLLDERMNLEPMNKLSSRPHLHGYPDPYLNKTIHSRDRSGELSSIDSTQKMYSRSATGPSAPSDGIWRTTNVLPATAIFEAKNSVPIPRYGGYVPTKAPEGPRLANSIPPTISTSALPITSNWVSKNGAQNGTVMKIPSRADEHKNVPSFLQSIGLAKYAILFQAEEVDMTILKTMGDKDLKDMGVPMGPRKKILLSLLPPERMTGSSSHH